ncbi:MAG: hypothetical protein RL264_2014 [Bacteroidota bacterium]|jgi:murein L,D-transpeptidase YcbB/YkuD
MRKLLSFFLLLLLFSCGSSNNDKDFLSDKSLSVGEKLQRVITSDYLSSWKLTSEQIDWLQAFYKSQNHQPVFMKDSALSKTGKVFLEETHHFLWYGLPEGRRLKMPENLTEIEKEVWLTLQLSTLINDLKTGCFSFDTKSFKPLKPADLSTVKTVLNRFKKEKINTVLLEVGPKDSTYYYLASQNYNFCKKYGTDSTSFSMKTQKEDSIDVWKKVRTVLSQKFKLDENSDSISTYKALNEYQLMNGLDPDGKLGRNTVKALNESNHEKALRACISMEKIRNSKVRPEKYVRINLPEFMLYVKEKNATIEAHKVVIGKISTQTPELESEIYKVVFYPYWSVPYSITSKEMLPDLKRDKNYLSRNHYKLYSGARELDGSSINWSNVNGSFPYRVVQQPGKHNSLGIVKFEFKNAHSVYVHDTPLKRFFNVAFRSYSHGCMRCDQPLQLAKTLLTMDSVGRKEAFTPEKVDSLITVGKHHPVSLMRPVPIFVEYQTVVGYPDRIVFYIDLYDRDEQWLRKFKKG